MDNGEFLWQALAVASVVGNVLQQWLRIRSAGKAMPVKTDGDPLETSEVRQPATMDNIKVLHHRLDGYDERIGVLEAARETDKRDVVTEIVRMREQSHEQFATLNRAIGRLEGARLNH